MGQTKLIPVNESSTIQTVHALHEHADPNCKPTSSLVSQLMIVEESAGGALVPDEGFFKSFMIEFLDRMSYRNTPEDCTTDLREVEEIAAAVAKLCHWSFAWKHIQCASLFSSLCLKFHPVEYKIKYAHYCAITLVIDILSERSMGDSDSENSIEAWHDDMSVFHVRMCDPEGFKELYPGRESLHPVLEDFITYMRTDENPFFPKYPMLHSLFIKGNLDYIAGANIEKCYDSLVEKEVQRLPERSQFPKFLRTKSGAGEPFSLFVVVSMADDQHLWYSHVLPMVPEIIQFMHHTNDIISLYKEVLAGEDMSHSVILNLAKLEDGTLLQGLRKVSAITAEVCKRMVAICDRSGSTDLKRVTRQLIQGYMTWHIALTSRYRMKEVLGDWFQGVYC